ncbi:hypothetical protein V1387_14660 [Allomuricauda taeanensis]|uniref:hypothetical protein n=1 Tax=Flagellimonas taeanensis TaxID=1005926 RepID=UPI002E7BD09A|nr:hypothetical protein [Allomuricauda taeanensis]MEE1963933.1 hypothetical protein [Allomuricauda taeanensis]
MKISWAFIALGLLVACNNDDDLETAPVSIIDDVWQLSSESENNQETTYPLTVKGDFDNDGTEETLSRNDFYIFEDNWAFRAYSYVVINDEGDDVITLPGRAEHLFAGAASPYTQNSDSISIFLKDYAIVQSGSELKLKSENHELVFAKVQKIDRSKVKNAPLEPENNGDLAAKTWRMKYETGFEARPDVYYPVEKTGDFDNDGTDETIARNDYYVFDIPWCYTAYISTVLDDQGSDQSSLLDDNGVLQIKHMNYFIFNATRDSMYFNGNAYAYFNDGENIILRKGNYEVMFELAPGVAANDVTTLYGEDKDLW